MEFHGNDFFFPRRCGLGVKLGFGLELGSGKKSMGIWGSGGGDAEMFFFEYV